MSGSAASRALATLPARFDHHATRQPRREAIAIGAESLDYATLRRRAGGVGQRLRELGCADRPVCVLGGVSLELVGGMLGILTAGGCVVPLDPSDGDARLEAILRRVAPAVILSAPEERERCRALCPAAEILPLDQGENAPPPDAPACAPDSLASILFTSGSTGEPKGVMQTHRNWLHAIGRYARALRLGPGERLYRPGSFAFAAGFRALFGALSQGATLVTDLGAPENVAGRLATHHATLLHAPAHFFRLLLEPDVDIGSLGRLRTIFVAGDALRSADARRFLRRFPKSTRLIHALAMTECSTVRQCVVEAALPMDGRFLPVGHPVEDMEILLLDDAHRPVSGDEGLIAVRSRYLSPGYFGRPDLTAAAFLPDPDGGEARVYLTGDRGRLGPDGLLRHLGRRDAKRKVRGFQVDLREVSAALLSLPGVRDGAVLAPEIAGETRLIAYVVAEARDADRLRRQLASLVPEYMIPSSFLFLDSLPRSPHGKLERARLPALDALRPGLRSAYIAPESPLEHALLACWRETFAAPWIGVEDDFFDLGGHSLLALRLVGRITEDVAELSLQELFAAPTVRQLAAALAGRAGSHPTGPALERRGADEDAPLSPGQRRLWFLHQLVGGAAYQVVRMFELEGDLSIPTLRRALGAIEERHVALRTCFPSVDGQPVQRVAPPGLFGLQFLDLSAGAPEAARRAAAFLTLPYELERDTWRVMLIRLGPRRHRLAFVIHHIACDVWSFDVLWRELGLLYGSFLASADARLPPLPLRYPDYAAWRAASADAAALEARCASLAGAPTVHALALDHPRPARQGFAGSALTFALDAELSAGLRALGRCRGATLFMTLLAGFSAVLFRHGGRRDQVIGTPIADRGDPRLAGLIGLFVNTLPLRLRWEGDPRFLEHLFLVREVALDAYAYREVPFESLVERLNPPRSLRHEPLVQVIFSLQTARNDAPRLEGLTVTPLPQERTATGYDLEVHLWEEGDALAGRWVYDSALFEEATVRLLQSHLRALLRAAVAAPETRLSELCLWGDDERETVLLRWNATARPFPQRSLPRLFEAQVARAPAAVALRCDGRATSYRALDEAANRIAHALLARGLRPDTPVGLCAPRSTAWVAGMLGILKAGGGYLPLDPCDPAPRLRQMLEDSSAALCLTSGEGGQKLAGSGVALLALEEALRAGPTHSPGIAVGPQQLAYVVYTSGSTGRPKGVAVAQSAVVRLVYGAYCRFGPDRVFLHAAAPTFDATTFELWGALLHGARVVLAPPERSAFGELPRLIAAEGVTTAWLTASLFNQLVDLEQIGPLRGLDELLIGGEALSPPHVARTRELLPETALINGYGPTEGTTFTTTFRIPPAPGAGPLPIGRPIANTRVYILDERLRPQPIGLRGELCIAGEGLARGYLGSPTLTAARFVEVELDGRSERVYRSGDVARWRSDGQLEFLGRRDQQVKVRGYRVEPGELEAVLRDHPAVRDAAVIARPRADTAELLAYVVHAADAHISSGALRNDLARQLPDWMLPAAITFLPRLPLTPHGKLDRAALPGPAEAAPAEGPRAAPENELERTLLALWRTELAVPGLGCEDDFFARGGSSLIAARLTVAMERAAERRIPLQLLFQHPTVRSLARAIDDCPDTCLVTLRPGAERPPLYLVHGLFGELFGLIDFARRLPGDFPVRGVQAIEHAGASRPTSFEGMAARYVSDLCAAQPEGPFFLCGYSLGGVVAFEIARQLQHRGRRVGQLFLLDTRVPRLPAWIHIASLLPHLPTDLRGHLARISRLPRPRWGRALRACADYYRALFGRNGCVRPLDRRHQEDAYYLLARDYIPRPTAIPTTLFACRGHGYYQAGPLWTILTRGRTRIVDFHLRHRELIYSDRLARLLSEHLLGDAG